MLSPGPSGSVQADLYRPLRLPTLLVGDHKLGGISTTLSAFESLHVRGYDVDSLLLFDDPKWGNFAYLQEYFRKHNVEAFSLPRPPPRQGTEQEDEAVMNDYYQSCAESDAVKAFLDLVNTKHFSRISKLTSMPSKADSIVWHPFRQHGIPHNIIAIDSAYGDNFEAYNQETDPSITNAPDDLSTGIAPAVSTKQAKSLTTPLFDASASWWTQGFGHGNPDLSLTAAHAAGRYGHVMFAHAVHEPALALCYNLLETLDNPRLARVFFSDNGSTAMEVAIKMALRASSLRYNWHKDDGGPPVEILGLKGSYHGDTIGTMNASEPSVFNKNVDWYRPQGVWLDAPKVIMRNGEWQIDADSDIYIGAGTSPPSHTQVYNDLSDVFDFESRRWTYGVYKGYIRKKLRDLSHDKGHRFGALVMEPIVMGAGGMIFVDPLFQRALIQVVRSEPYLIKPSGGIPSGGIPLRKYAWKGGSGEWSGLPVIADEVFTGLYRLGRASSSSLLASNTDRSAGLPDGCSVSGAPDPGPYPGYPDGWSVSCAPDISAHAKLLTGGLLPLALTCASDSIFQSFYSDAKPDALLHGHSYTAHAVGCAVANHSLAEMAKLDVSSTSHWNDFRADWSAAESAMTGGNTASTETSSDLSEDPIWSVFPPDFLKELSHHPLLDGVWSLGTVLAMTMASDASGGDGGYSSNASASLQARLLTTLDPVTGEGIHARVLGDVIYIMTSLTTTKKTVTRISEMLGRALDEEHIARSLSKKPKRMSKRWSSLRGKGR